jgi:hypothetical protein
MPQSRVLGVWLAVFGTLSFYASAAMSESPTQNLPPPSSRSSGAVTVPQVHPQRVTLPADRHVRRDQAVRPMTVEGDSRISLDRLRRELYRYPDSDMVTRFLELTTERPPLFGSDEER